MEDKKGRWNIELHSILWFLRFTQKEATGQTPFRLVYGSEALMLVEMGSTSLRVQLYNKVKNNQILTERLNSIMRQAKKHL
ncbi:Nuclear receptor subfamily 0 group B member 1 [Bienertia sinuspersici]